MSFDFCVFCLCLYFFHFFCFSIMSKHHLCNKELRNRKSSQPAGRSHGFGPVRVLSKGLHLWCRSRIEGSWGQAKALATLRPPSCHPVPDDHNWQNPRPSEHGRTPISSPAQELSCTQVCLPAATQVETHLGKWHLKGDTAKWPPPIMLNPSFRPEWVGVFVPSSPQTPPTVVFPPPCTPYPSF